MFNKAREMRGPGAGYVGPIEPDHSRMEIITVKNGFMINVTECKDGQYTDDVFVFPNWKEAFDFINETYKEE